MHAKFVVTNSLYAEILVLERAVKLCYELMIDNIIFYENALAMVKAIKAKENNYLRYGQIIRDIKKILKVEILEEFNMYLDVRIK